MWNLKKKMIQMNLFTEQKYTHRQKTNLWLPKGIDGVGRRDQLRVWAMEPTPVLLARKFHGRRSLVGCSPWGR